MSTNDLDWEQHTHALKKLLDDPGRLLTKDGFGSDAEFLAWGEDRSKLQKANFKLLIFPKNTAEISRVVSYCYEHKLGIVPSSGRTGLVGGAIASNNEIVISLVRMDSLIKLDSKKNYIQAQAGMITANANELAASIGCSFPIDLAASGSSCIGGNVATHAGGIHVIRHGLLRNHVLGMTVVTGTGAVLELYEDVIKNNTGFLLMPLFIGSEGLLGIISELRIGLVPKPSEHGLALLSIASLGSGLELLEKARSAGILLSGFEYFDRLSYDLVCRHLELPDLFCEEDKHFLLIEWEIDEAKSSDASVLDWLAQYLEFQIRDARHAQSQKQKKMFWSYRESISESLSHECDVHKNDISIPLDSIERFVDIVSTYLNKKWPDLRLCIFGHLGDGNLHLNLIKPAVMPEQDFIDLCHKFDDFVYHKLVELKGSISAEHGIGVLKKEYLSLVKSVSEIEYMKKIKAVFDPGGILNPGKMFLDESSHSK